MVADLFSLGFWSGLIAIRYTSYHFRNRNVPTPLRHAKKKICSNGNRRPIRYLFQWKQKANPISVLMETKGLSVMKNGTKR